MHPALGFEEPEKNYKIVDSLNQLKKRTFLEKYYKKKKPLLISQATLNWKALHKWSEDYFIEKIGHKNITLNSFKYLPNKIIRTVLPEMTIAESIKIMRNNKDLSERYYLLRNSIPNNYPELLEDLGNFPWVDSNIFYSRDLWFGDSLNITPIHFDAADNFIVPIFGSKTVYLYPPKHTRALYPHILFSQGRFNFAQTVSRFYASAQIFPLFFEKNCYRIDIHPGDILYIPIGWWHEVHTHSNRAASVTYFFNNRKNTCLLWHFLSYQSCRLHEISHEKEVQNFLYVTNYSNAFYSAKKLQEHKQYWMAVVLAGAMLEHVLNLVTGNYYSDLQKLLQFYPNNPFIKELIQNNQWNMWEHLITLGKEENNEALKDFDIKKFIHDIENYTKQSIEKINLPISQKYDPLIEVKNISTLASY